MSAPEVGRRQFLQLTTAAGAAIVLSSAVGAPAARAAVGPRVYVLVVDGMRPGEISALSTPTLHRLRSDGSWYSSARSLPVMETIPNHVMMMTGVRPDRSGVPANAIFDRAAGIERDLDRPTDLRFPTLLERLRSTGRTTGSVLSKDYLFGIFDGKATYQWEPAPSIPVSGHAPDVFTMDAAIEMVTEFDPDLVFVNLGDVDRTGHSDLSGSALNTPAARTAALTTQDAQFARFVLHLQQAGKWASSVLVVLADHSMDFSRPDRFISVDQILSARPDLRASIEIAQNGGADLLYWVGAAGRARTRGLDEVRRLVAAHPGVLSVNRPGDLRLGPEAGDLVCFCRAGWRFTDPTPVSNPIPGNHGHPVTEPIPFFVAGGHPAVRRGRTSVAAARTVDVAPTVGALFGLAGPRGGYDGTARTDAFTAVPLR